MTSNTENLEDNEFFSIEPKRTIQVGAKVSESEYEILQKLAKDGGYRSITDYIRSVAVYEHPKLREGLELLPEINRNVKDLTDKLIGKETGSAPIIKHSPTGLIPLESSPESENSDSYDIAKDGDLNAHKRERKIPSLDDTGTVIESGLKEIEEDVNLDSFGSGSGLLDLSLQADDTSLGGILDEIYAPENQVEPELPEPIDYELQLKLLYKKLKKM